MEGPLSRGGRLKGWGVLPDTGIYNRGAFSFLFFTYLSLEMMASAPVATVSAPVATVSAPVATASAPVATVSAPVSNEKKDKIISYLRDLFCKFKVPYLEERDGDDENSSLQDIYEVEDSANHIDQLFLIVSGFINANGVPPITTDVNILSIYKVFEPIMKELVANPSLKDEMMHYTILDLRTYPFTISKYHINRLDKNGIQPLKRIIPNTESNSVQR